jgi:hypothetical protein
MLWLLILDPILWVESPPLSGAYYEKIIFNRVFIHTHTQSKSHKMVHHSQWNWPSNVTMPWHVREGNQRN